LRSLGSALAFVGNAINGSREVVGYQQRPIGQHGDIDRPPHVFARRQPSIGEDLRFLRLAVFVQAREQYASAYRSRAIPGPVLGREYATGVFRGERPEE